MRPLHPCGRGQPDIASSTRSSAAVQERWQVDPLTRKVFVHTLTALVEPDEAERLRNAFTEQSGHLDPRDLSEDGRAVYPLLTALDTDCAETTLHRLPFAVREHLDRLSPIRYMKDIRAPLIVLLHDRDDVVIPVSESRRLWSALARRAGVHYTELQFQHLDPTKLPLFRLVRELGKFLLAVYPMFWQATASRKDTEKNTYATVNQ